MNKTKQKSLPSQKSQDEINGFDYHQPSNTGDIFLLEAIANQVANSETEAAKAIANIQAQIDELFMIFRTEAPEKTRVHSDKVTKTKTEHVEKAGLEEKARAYEKLLEKYGSEATTRVEFETKAETERQARTEAEAKAKSYAKTSVEIMKKLHAQTQAKVEAEEKLKAEIQEKLRAEQLARAEAQERAKAERRLKVQANVIANVQAQIEELVMMFRTEAQKKTKAYTDILTKIKTDHEEKAEQEKISRAFEKIPAKNDDGNRDRSESKTKSVPEKKVCTEAEAHKLMDIFITEPRSEEMFYPQRLSWSQWLLRGLREDRISAVIVFCLLLYIVPATLAISSYFVYKLLITFL